MTTTLLDPKLLGFWARCVREAQHLSQEALAEAAGITVRTVQRFEAGEGVQIGSRRSLAKAPGYDDQDIFDDPKFAAEVLGFVDDIKAFQQKQVDDQHPDQMRLPARLISCGEEAIQFAQGNRQQCNRSTFTSSISHNSPPVACFVVSDSSIYCRHSPEINLWRQLSWGGAAATAAP